MTGTEFTVPYGLVSSGLTVSTVPVIFGNHRFLLEVVGENMYYAAKADVKFITYIEQTESPPTEKFIDEDLVLYCAGVVLQLLAYYKGSKQFKQSFCPEFKYLPAKRGYQIDVTQVKMYRGVSVQKISGRDLRVDSYLDDEVNCNEICQLHLFYKLMKFKAIDTVDILEQRIFTSSIDLGFFFEAIQLAIDAYRRDGDEDMELQINEKFLQPESILHLLKLPDADQHRFNVYHTVDIVKDDIRQFFYNPAARV